MPAVGVGSTRTVLVWVTTISTPSEVEVKVWTMTMELGVMGSSGCWGCSVVLGGSTVWGLALEVVVKVVEGTMNTMLVEVQRVVR